MDTQEFYNRHASNGGDLAKWDGTLPPEPTTERKANPKLKRHNYKFKKMEELKIVFVEYNGANRPLQVWTDKNEMFYFSMKEGSFQAEWAGKSNPYIHKLREGIKPRRIWFKEEFRPTNGALVEQIALQNKEINEFGFSVIENPTHIEEIIKAINNS